MLIPYAARAWNRRLTGRPTLVSRPPATIADDLRNNRSALKNRTEFNCDSDDLDIGWGRSLETIRAARVDPDRVLRMAGLDSLTDARSGTQIEGRWEETLEKGG